MAWFEDAAGVAEPVMRKKREGGGGGRGFIPPGEARRSSGPCGPGRGGISEYSSGTRTGFPARPLRRSPGGGIPVIFMRPNKGLHILGRKQNHRMPHSLELPSPEAGGSAGFHRDGAERNVLKGRGKIFSRDLLFHDAMSFFVQPHKMKHGFCQIQANCRNLHGGSSLFPVFGDG